jgi:outer membrane protein OmpA-like peptidoglycan-associated protein
MRTIALFVIFLIAGCSNGSMGATEYGALGGTAAGAGLGAIIGNQTGNPGAGVAIGAAAGAIGGAIIGGQIDRHDQKIREQQSKIDEQDRLLSENSQLLTELRQRGIDVRDSDRGVVINLPDVLFHTGRSELTREAVATIQEIATALRGAPHRRVSVEGHTDSLGTIEFNYRLSDARARTVAHELESSGVPQHRIAIRAMGETSPIASNRTEQGRQRNRRVEIVIEN